MTWHPDEPVTTGIKRHEQMHQCFQLAESFFLIHHFSVIFIKDSSMFTSLQNPLSLIGRILLALLFIPAGFGKITGFAGTVAYIASKG
ncbi:MAG: DoxX family protein, partial [Polaromonas sp.]